METAVFGTRVLNTMNYPIDEVLESICFKILNEGKSIEEWSDIESDDMYQKENYVGGFDADEREFCFSIYIASTEYWFQFSLEEANRIHNGELTTIEIRLAE